MCCARVVAAAGADDADAGSSLLRSHALMQRITIVGIWVRKEKLQMKHEEEEDG